MKNDNAPAGARRWLAEVLRKNCSGGPAVHTSVPLSAVRLLAAIFAHADLTDTEQLELFRKLGVKNPPQ